MMAVMSTYAGPGRPDDLEPDAEAILGQLRWWFEWSRRGEVEVGWFDPVTGELNRFRRFDIGDLDEAAAFVAEVNAVPGQSVYFRPALIRPGAPRFVTDRDFLESPGAWCDLDAPGRADQARNLHTICRPNMAVVTGRRPHTRAQLFWRLEDTDAITVGDGLRRLNRGIAAVLGGDMKVVNPTTLMRVAGTIAWPWKPGREIERTELRLFRDGRPGAYALQAVLRAFPPPEAGSSGAGATTGTDRSPLTGRLRVREVLASIGPGNWHNPVVKIIGHMVSKGEPDWVIRGLLAPYLNRGNTPRTEADVQKIVDGARAKWNRPDTAEAWEEDFDAAAPPPEPEPGPFPASDLKGEPPARRWIVPDWLPMGAVTALYGDGGMGKTLLAQQLGTACATGTAWLGMDVCRCRVLAVLCEDDRDELHRRQRAINAACGVALSAQVGELHLWPRVGHGNLLVEFDLAGRAHPTPFHGRLVEEVKRLEPGLLILDTSADLYGGNEINRAQVTLFLKTIVGGFVADHGCTVLMLAHPSVAGMATGTGSGGSTAWNNGVRSRWYLAKPEGGSDDQRVLTRKKANYAAAGDNERIDLIWDEGVLGLPRTPDALDRMERRAVKRRVLRAIEAAWGAGRPYTGKGRGGRPYDMWLARETGDDVRAVVEVVRELEGLGVIGSDRLPGHNSPRGYRVLVWPEWA
jgi:hypothetical protein